MRGRGLLPAVPSRVLPFLNSLPDGSSLTTPSDELIPPERMLQPALPLPDSHPALGVSSAGLLHSSGCPLVALSGLIHALPAQSARQLICPVSTSALTAGGASRAGLSPWDERHQKH